MANNNIDFSGWKNMIWQNFSLYVEGKTSLPITSRMRFTSELSEYVIITIQFIYQYGATPTLDTVYHFL